MAVALASGGGANLNKAQKIAFESHTKIFGEEPSKTEQLAMAEIANLVETTGARVSDLLKSQARIMQRENLTANELRIEQLSVRLMLPLGLAVLPAFVCLAVIPLMASMFGPK
jgi:tight adherence protein B